MPWQVYVRIAFWAYVFSALYVKRACNNRCEQWNNMDSICMMACCICWAWDFVDAIFLFANTSGTLVYLLDTLVDTLEGVGLRLNMSKTVIATTEAPPPPLSTTSCGEHYKNLKLWAIALMVYMHPNVFGIQVHKRRQRVPHSSCKQQFLCQSNNFMWQKCFHPSNASIFPRTCDFSRLFKSFGAGLRAIHSEDLQRCHIKPRNFWEVLGHHQV